MLRIADRFGRCCWTSLERIAPPSRTIIRCAPAIKGVLARCGHIFWVPPSNRACISGPVFDHLPDLISDARGASRRGCTPGRTSPRRQVNAGGEWVCSQCQTFLPRTDFAKNSTAASGLQSSCRKCRAAQNFEHTRTLRGNAMGLVSQARSRARGRGRLCSLTHEDILDMLGRQEGRCFYSGIAMQILEPNSHWRMSLERLDNKLGYTVENCALIAAEFNSSDYSSSAVHEVHGSAQWSRAKWHAVPVLREIALDLQPLASSIDGASGRQRLRLQRSIPSHVANSLGQKWCCGCANFKPTDNFYADLRLACALFSQCKTCCRQKTYHYNRTLSGNVSSMLGRARERAAHRGHDFSLARNDILDMLWAQGGRCYYSVVPVEYLVPNSNWRMSLERLDNGAGYTQRNCVLIANEFQTSDQSRNKSVYKVHGTAQWSRGKAAYVWGPFFND